MVMASRQSRSKCCHLFSRDVSEALTHVVSWKATNSILGSLMDPPPPGDPRSAVATCSAYVLHGLPAHLFWLCTCSMR